MSEQTNPEAPQTAPTEQTVTATSVADLIAYEEAREAERANRQAEAERAAELGIAESIKATADAERASYLKATEPTRNASGYRERFKAYDRVRLAFIEGTTADTAKDAKDKAKALPAYKDVSAADIETRPI